MGWHRNLAWHLIRGDLYIMWTSIVEVFQYREMLRNLIAKELRAKYKASVLGFLWTFINPLFMLIVYSIAFGIVLRIQQQNYSMFLFVALLPWNYLVVSIQQGTSAIVGNASFVKKIYFPRAVLPLAVVFANLVNFLLSLLIMVPALLLFHVRLTESVISLPAILFVQTLLVMALTLLASVGNVYLRDLEHIITVIILAWMYVTPIFYSASMIPSAWRGFFNANPATSIINAYRAIFFYGQWPQWSSLAWLTGILIVFLVMSWAVFGRAQRGLAEEI